MVKETLGEILFVLTALDLHSQQSIVIKKQKHDPNTTLLRRLQFLILKFKRYLNLSTCFYYYYYYCNFIWETFYYKNLGDLLFTTNPETWLPTQFAQNSYRYMWILFFKKRNQSWNGSAFISSPLNCCSPLRTRSHIFNLFNMQQRGFEPRPSEGFAKIPASRRPPQPTAARWHV